MRADTSAIPRSRTLMADEPASHDDDNGDLEDMFESWYQERVKKDEAKRNRNKQPKDFGEFLDRVADAVWERGEARAAERRKAAEDADEEPDRGAGQSKFQQWWSGERSAS